MNECIFPLVNCVTTGTIKDELWKIIDNSSNSITNLPIEVINTSLLIILVDAFMRCNILEEPPTK